MSVVLKKRSCFSKLWWNLLSLQGKRAGEVFTGATRRGKTRSGEVTGISSFYLRLAMRLLLRPIPRHFSRCGAKREAAMLRLQLGHTHSLFFHWLYTWPNTSSPGWSTISGNVKQALSVACRRLFALMQFWHSLSLIPKQKVIVAQEGFFRSCQVKKNVV